MEPLIIFIAMLGIASALLVLIVFFIVNRSRRGPLLPGGKKRDSCFWTWLDCGSSNSNSSDSTHHGSSHHGHSGSSHHGGDFGGGGHHGGGFDGGGGFGGGHH